MLDDEKRKEIGENAVQFEKNHGSSTFLKVTLSSIARLLVEKEIVSEEELLDSFSRQIQEYKEQIQASLIDMLNNDEPIDVDELEKKAMRCHYQCGTKTIINDKKEGEKE